MELNEKNSSVTNQTGTSSLARAEATPTIVREETESLTPPTPVARKDRIFSLDVIRGVALLGILLVNIENFAGPEALHDIPVGTPIAAFSGPHAPLHLFILMLKWIFFEGKMNFLFCMLFGASVVLMTTRAERRGTGQQIADIYLRRNLWLALFGLLHGIFIWSGDVLFDYGLVGVLMLFACRKLKARTLFITGTCISVPLVTIVLFFWLGSANDFNLSRQAAVADAQERAGQPLTPEQKQAQRDWTARVESQKITQQSIAASMSVAHETYVAGVIHRVEDYLGSRAAITHFTFATQDLGAMLIGMGLFKFGFLTAEQPYGTYIWTAALGFLVAAPMYVIGMWKAYISGFSVLSFDKWICLPYFFNREAAGLALLSIILLVVKSGVLRTFQSMLAAVGRTALRNYLLTSILCQFLFLWGPWKLYGKLEYYQYNYVVLVVWMINLVGSALWLRAFRFGPMEWVWRSLTYLKFQPMRINPSVPAGLTVGAWILAAGFPLPVDFQIYGKNRQIVSRPKRYYIRGAGITGRATIGTAATHQLNGRLPLRACLRGPGVLPRFVFSVATFGSYLRKKTGRPTRRSEQFAFDPSLRGKRTAYRSWPHLRMVEFHDCRFARQLKQQNSRHADPI